MKPTTMRARVKHIKSVPCMQMGQASVDSPLGKQILKLFCILPDVDFVCIHARNISVRLNYLIRYGI